MELWNTPTQQPFCIAKALLQESTTTDSHHENTLGVL